MSQVRKILDFIKMDVLGTDNRYMAFAWISAVTGVLILGVYLTSETMSFMGIADSRELQVNFEYTVEIKRIHVLPGQLVKQGDLLIELNASTLNSRLRELQMQMSTLQAEMKVRQRLNTILNNKGLSTAGGMAKDDLDPSDPLAVQINDLNEEIALVENQKKNLYIFASIPGIIGAVNYKKGEKVPAFSPLLTISSENPTFIQGFIHESLHTHLEVGRKVKVILASGGRPSIEGTVVSVGSRIVPFPPRLTHNTQMSVWGREVTVELPEDNKLLLGEKVILKPRFHFFGPGGVGFTSAIASLEEKRARVRAKQSGPHEINFPPVLADRLSFEPSGLIYLEEIKKFMVVSDDTDTSKTPYVFLMDSEGQVDDQPLRLPGIQAVNDLESIGTDGKWVYLLTSQSVGSKKDESEFQGARDLFIRTQFSGLRFGTTESVHLRPLLLKAVSASKNADLRKALSQLENIDLEIESHLVTNDTLILGLKAPVTVDGKTVILSIRNMSRLFQSQVLDPSDLKIERLVTFNDSTSCQHQLTDLALTGENLYATTKCHKHIRGSLWKIPLEKETVQAKLIQRFDGRNSEGVAWDPQSRSLLVTFDQGSAKAAFEKVPVEEEASQKQ